MLPLYWISGFLHCESIEVIRDEKSHYRIDSNMNRINTTYFAIHSSITSSKSYTDSNSSRARQSYPRFPKFHYSVFLHRTFSQHNITYLITKWLPHSPRQIPKQQFSSAPTKDVRTTANAPPPPPTPKPLFPPPPYKPHHNHWMN